MREVRIVIAEGSAIVRERLEILLTGIDGLRLVGAMEASLEARCAISCLRPDAVILGMRIDDPNAVSLVMALKEDHPGVFIIALNNAPCTPCRERFLAAGADLFLDKSREYDRILPALARLLDPPSPEAREPAEPRRARASRPQAGDQGSGDGT